MKMHSGFQSILTAALLCAAAPAQATTFFGEDVGAFPGPYTNSNLAQADFLAMLVTPGTEDFHAFDYPDTAPLALSFRNPPGALGTEIATGALTDPTGDGFIATAMIAKTGFPISGPSYWKNETDEDAGLFSVAFDAQQRGFGFYATGYSTLSGADGTQLVLDLELQAGGTASFVIPHSTAFTLGNVFYFGVITDPFVRATLRNQGDDDGDVIGFDDFSVGNAVVPEPASGLLLAGGLLALAASRRR